MNAWMHKTLEQTSYMTMNAQYCYLYFMYKYWQMNDIGDGDISCLVNHRSTQMHHNIMCLYQLQQLRIHTLLKNITQHTQCTLKSF